MESKKKELNLYVYEVPNETAHMEKEKGETLPTLLNVMSKLPGLRVSYFFNYSFPYFQFFKMSIY